MLRYVNKDNKDNKDNQCKDEYEVFFFTEPYKTNIIDDFQIKFI